MAKAVTSDVTVGLLTLLVAAGAVPAVLLNQRIERTLPG